MEESKAAAFYEEQRASGAGAAKFKHGLGFTNRPTCPPSNGPPPSHSAPDGGQARPMMSAQAMPPPMVRNHLPTPPANVLSPYLTSAGPRPPMYPPLAFTPPPGPYPPHPLLPPRVGVPIMPPRPPGHPPQALPLSPAVRGLPMARPGMEGWQPVPPPRPPVGLPPPLPVRPTAVSGPPPGWPRSSPGVVVTPAKTDDVPSTATPLLERILVEGSVQHSIGKKTEEESKKRKESQSWTAHKADDGSVYYYNTFTGKSSWEKPDAFNTAESKVTETPKPVASERIKGCDWNIVKCEDGRKYFFHVITQETVWSEPAEVTRAKEAEEQALKIQSTPPQSRTTPVTPPVRPVSAKYPRSTPLQKKTSSGVKAQQPSEELIAKFKDLLSEKGVNPFSCFEREMPKMDQDSRWKAIPSLKEKRSIFDDFCRTLAEKQRQSKENAARVAADGFVDLLEAIAEHEVVQQAERKRRKAAEREEGEMDTGDSGEEDETEVPGLSPNTTLEQLETFWGNDKRWKACSPETRKRLFESKQGPKQSNTSDSRQKGRSLLESNFRAMLQEHKTGFSSRWSKMKGVLQSDKRFTAVPSGDREELFRKYVEEIKVLEEQERRKERAQLAREREMRLRMERDEVEADRRKHRAAHSDAVAAFQTLLGEVVKDPDVMWRDWKSKLERDPQGRATNPVLEQRELERLFRDHVKDLMDVANRDYRELLEEMVRPLLPSKEAPASGSKNSHPALHSFDAAEDLMQEDPRFQRAPKDARERLWRRFIEDVFQDSGPPVRMSNHDRDKRDGRDREPFGHRQRYRADDHLIDRERGSKKYIERERGRGRDRRDRRSRHQGRDDSPAGRDRKRSRA